MRLTFTIAGNKTYDRLFCVPKNKIHCHTVSLTTNIIIVFNISNFMNAAESKYGLWFWCLTPISTLFQPVSWRSVGWGNRNTWRKPPTCRKALTHFIKNILKIPKGQSETVFRKRTDKAMAKRKSTKAHPMLYQVHLAMSGIQTDNLRHWLHR